MAKKVIKTISSFCGTTANNDSHSHSCFLAVLLFCNCDIPISSDLGCSALAAFVDRKVLFFFLCFSWCPDVLIISRMASTNIATISPIRPPAALCIQSHASSIEAMKWAFIEVNWTRLRWSLMGPCRVFIFSVHLKPLVDAAWSTWYQTRTELKCKCSTKRLYLAIINSNLPFKSH